MSNIVNKLFYLVRQLFHIFQKLVEMIYTKMSQTGTEYASLIVTNFKNSLFAKINGGFIFA